MALPKYPCRFLSVALVLMLAPFAWSQQQENNGPQENGPVEQQRDRSQDQSQEGSVETFKVDVNVVNIFFNVKDKRGGLIPSLTKNDFELFEDGKAQTIKYFSAESNLPLTLGILIDTSPSQIRVLPMEKEVGADFLRQILTDRDEAFVISFDANVDLLQDFTNSQRLLRTALESTKIGGGGFSGGPGLGQGPLPSSRACCTMLYDAVYLASNEKLASEVGRKAMILLTDGQDEGSRETVRDAVEAAQKADSICYVLLIADRGFYGFGGYSGDREMRKLTEDTGGRVIEVGNKLEKLREGFQQIANELRSQYSVGYTPTNSRKDGTFRQIEIKAKGGDYKVQARKGYYALPPRE